MMENVKITRSKWVLYALVTVYVVSLLCNIFLFITKANLSQENAALTREFSALSDDNKKRLRLMGKFEESQQDLKNQLKKSEITVKTLSARLEEEIKKDSQFADTMRTRESEIQRLKNVIASHEKENKRLLKRIGLLNETLDGVKAKFADLTSEAGQESQKEIMELNKKIEKLSKEKEAASLGTIVIR